MPAQVPPLFAFGAGLSYAAFEYSDLQLIPCPTAKDRGKAAKASGSGTAGLHPSGKEASGAFQGAGAGVGGSLGQEVDGALGQGRVVASKGAPPRSKEACVPQLRVRVTHTGYPHLQQGEGKGSEGKSEGLVGLSTDQHVQVLGLGGLETAQVSRMWRALSARAAKKTAAVARSGKQAAVVHAGDAIFHVKKGLSEAEEVVLAFLEREPSDYPEPGERRGGADHA